MPQHPGRFIGASALLLGAWVCTYWLWPVSGARISFADGPPLVEDSATPVPTVVVPPPRPEPPPSQPGPRMVQRMEPPRFTEYVVARGDVSWDVISRKVYGSSKWASAISKANPFVSPDKLKVGKTRLKIPVDPTNIQGKLVWVPEGGADRASGGAQPQPPPAPDTTPTPAPTPGPGSSWPTAELTHTVKSGETLSGIAKLYYSAPAGYLKIYEANRDKLTSMDKLKPGMVLRIPPGP